jgi:NADH pyrophosphatase NudC (nudix superfamily)
MTDSANQVKMKVAIFGARLYGKRMKDQFCSHCGTQFANDGYPRLCVNKPACGALTWQNPQPVVVVLQPVVQHFEHGDAWGKTDRTGAIIAKRAIWPKKGEWSLISGYINVDENETAEEAARREFREETSLELAGEPIYVGSAQNAGGILMLYFVASQAMTYEEFLRGKPCEENEELAVKWRGDTSDLAFPLQSQLFQRWVLNDR